MADNVTIPTVGIGSTTPLIATDDVAGAHFQRIKLDVGADGVSAPVSGSLPVTVLSTSPGTGPTDLGKAESSAHASGDVGVLSLAVRRDGFGTFAADGQYSPLAIDPTGALRVSVNNTFTLAQIAAQSLVTVTSGVLVSAPGARIRVTNLQLQAFGANAGDCIVYFGTGAYVRGTDRAVFDGHFIPTATFAPGVIMAGWFIAQSFSAELRITTTGNLNLTVNVWYDLIS